MTTNSDIAALAGELSKADTIIRVMLGAMTLAQKFKVAEKLDADGISPDGMTRANERLALLVKFGMQS